MGVAVALFEACASDPNGTTSGTRSGTGNGTGNGTGSGTGGGTGNGAGGSGNTGGSTTGGGGSIGPINPGNPDAGADIKVSADAACAAQETKGDKKQIDLMLMMDSSGSMDMTDPGQTATRWANLSMAMPGFVNDMANAGMAVGLDFFPEGGNLPLCNATDYQNVDVPIAPLPGNAMAIINAVNARARTGGTPTAPALSGAIASAKVYAMANPTRQVAVLLLTDGEPTGCGVNNANPTGPAVMAAQQGANGTPSIKTYVLGVGPSTGNLDAIAAAGGTMKAYMATSGGAADLSKALADIRKSTLSCDYNIPKPEGGTLDPNKVVVSVREGATGNFVEVPNVGNVSGCAQSPMNMQGIGWYYDNPSAPTKITLCPNSCGPLQVVDGSQVNILLGCEPKRIPPPN
jgi:hypothetical protein